jgi:hypothetical protein
MTWQYKTQRLAVGETLVVPDGDMMVGSNIEPDGKGGFRVIVHLLVRVEGAPMETHGMAAEPRQ